MEYILCILNLLHHQFFVGTKIPHGSKLKLIYSLGWGRGLLPNFCMQMCQHGLRTLTLSLTNKRQTPFLLQNLPKLQPISYKIPFLDIPFLWHFCRKNIPFLLHFCQKAYQWHTCGTPNIVRAPSGYYGLATIQSGTACNGFFSRTCFSFKGPNSQKGVTYSRSCCRLKKLQQHTGWQCSNLIDRPPTALVTCMSDHRSTA